MAEVVIRATDEPICRQAGAEICLGAPFRRCIGVSQSPQPGPRSPRRGRARARPRVGRRSGPPWLLRAARVRDVCSCRDRRERLDEGRPQPGHWCARRFLGFGRRSRAELAEVGGLALPHVTDDPLEVTAATSRTLAQLRAGGLCGGRIERIPAGSEDRGHPPKRLGVDGCVVVSRDRARSAEVGGAAAGKMLDDLQGSHVMGKDEAQSRTPGHAGIPR